MQESTVSTNVVSIGSKDILTEILRDGAQKMLATAIDCEVNEYLAEHAHQLDTNGKRLVVRNGYLPTREIQTGLGQVPFASLESTTSERTRMGPHTVL